MSQHLMREVDRLKREVLSLSTLVEERVYEAVRAVLQRDEKLAKSVLEGDAQIDQAEVVLEEECLKVLALHQPVARDLRFVIAVLKMNNDLERMGDKAANIAKRALALALQKPVEVPFDLEDMARKVQVMLHKSLDALINWDADLATEVLVSDDEIDAMRRQSQEIIEDILRHEPEQSDQLLQHLTICRQLERIGDLATNVAEDIIYMVKGDIVRHGARA